MNNFKIKCLGSQDMMPVKGNDCSNYLINESILIDCGTSPVMNLLNAGVDIAAIKNIVFSHMHPDHCVGFASLMYYMSSVLCVDMDTVTVYGPENLIGNFIEKTYAYIGYEANVKRPKAIGLSGGESLNLQADAMPIVMDVLSAQHAVPGNCLKFTSNWQSVGFSGDTKYFPALSEFFRGCEFIIYECSFSDTDSNDQKIAYGHSSPSDAVAVATEAGVKRVFLTHARNNHDLRVEQFRSASQIPVTFISFGDIIE